MKTSKEIDALADEISDKHEISDERLRLLIQLAYGSGYMEGIEDCQDTFISAAIEGDENATP